MKLYQFNGPTFIKVEDARPDAVAVTIPMRFFEEYPGGEPAFERMMRIVDRGTTTWMQTIMAKPVHDVEFVYFVYDGLVRYRLTILQYHLGKSMTFRDGGEVREFENKNWVELCGPVIKAPSEFFLRGFQGFRYTSFIF